MSTPWSVSDVPRLSVIFCSYFRKKKKSTLIQNSASLLRFCWISKLVVIFPDCISEREAFIWLQINRQELWNMKTDHRWSTGQHLGCVPILFSHSLPTSPTHLRLHIPYLTHLQHKMSVYVAQSGWSDF